MAENVLDNGQSLIQNVTDNAVGGVSGIFSVKPMAKYISGARCVLRVNGKIVGFAFAISWNINTKATEINTIDDYLPYELAPQRIEVSGAISGFRVPGTGPGTELMQADIESFLHQRYIEIEVRDSQTNNLLFYTNKALVTSRTENIKSESLADLTMSFKAIGFSDERNPQKPSGIGSPVQ